MLFAVDVGNSHTVSGVFSGELLAAEWRLKSDRNRTADELAIRYHTLFQMVGIDPGEINGFVISSVVPTLETSWLSYADRTFGNQLFYPALSVNHSIKTGLTIAIDNPAEVGADRIVNAVAAFERFPGNLIIIDFGTAITFDCVNSKKEYLGGAILPGVSISLDALTARTAQLPSVDIDKDQDNAMGRNTVDAIRSGLLFGFGGMVDRMVERLSSELCPAGEPLTVIATGGMAEVIAPYTNSVEMIEPQLTLDGLRIIHDANSIKP